MQETIARQVLEFVEQPDLTPEEFEEKKATEKKDEKPAAPHDPYSVRRGGRMARGGRGGARGGRTTTVNSKGLGMIEVYQKACTKISAAVRSTNPDYEKQVATAIRPHVVELIGEDRADECVALLINMPLEQIRHFLKDYGFFAEYVT